MNHMGDLITMKRPFILFLCILTLTLATPVTVMAAASFSDIQGHWGENYIHQTTDAGLIHGYPDGTFKPDQAITRAEFITILAQESGEAIDDEANTTEFKDVPQNNWARSYILWGRKNNVVSGYEDNTFRPNQTISRQEMATLLYRYIVNYRHQTVLSIQAEMTFQDENRIDGWAKDAVKAMQRSAIINGKGNDTFDPLSGATRAETTVMIGRYLTYYRSNTDSDLSFARVYVDNRLKAEGIPLAERNGKTMIALRNFLTAAGYRISYFSLPELIVADSIDRDIELWVNKADYYANGTKSTFSVAPTKERDITFVPLAEILSAANLAATMKEESGMLSIYISGSDNPLLRGGNNFYGSASQGSAVNGKAYLGGNDFGFFGTLAAGQMTYGSYTTPSGDLFFGYWGNGMLNGAGRSVTSYGQFYAGTFTNGAKATGITYFTDGSFFKGTWTKVSSGAVYPAKGQYTAADGTAYGNDNSEWPYGALTKGDW